MEVLTGFLGIIVLIASILAFIALISIADNTKKTNKLLRLMLNEQNPERFQITTLASKIFDTKLGKKY